MRTQISIRIDSKLLARIDKARGKVSRGQWIDKCMTAPSYCLCGEELLCPLCDADAIKEIAQDMD